MAAGSVPKTPRLTKVTPHDSARGPTRERPQTRTSRGSRMKSVVSTKPKNVRSHHTFTTEERDDIITSLSNPGVGPGTRAGMFLRKFGKLLTVTQRRKGAVQIVPMSPVARLLYLQIAGMMGLNRKHPDQVSVTLKTLSGFVGRGPHSVQVALQELTRSGVLPLLLQRPAVQGGGRASTYTWVNNPFSIAATQAVDAKKTRMHRSKKAQALPAVAAQRYQTWNTTTRPPVLVSDKTPAVDAVALRRHELAQKALKERQAASDEFFTAS